ncbi:MAG: hypothetical protein HQL67_12850 [Magnetococcales bacterium]|nr:hypothetical protein [Magnetococcales bacterium]
MADHSKAKTSKNSALLAITILIVSIGISLFVSEFVLRWFAPQDLTGSFHERSVDGLILNRSNYATIHSFGKIRANYRINKLHLRGGEIDYKKRKVLVLGDSFTFGWLLPEDKTYVDRLQAFADGDPEFANHQILNGGVGGHGTASQLLFLEHYLSLIQPDAVLVFLNGDDIGRSIKTRFYTNIHSTGYELQFNPGERVPKIEFLMNLKKMLVSLPLVDSLLTHSHLVQLIRKFFTVSRFTLVRNSGVVNVPEKGPGSQDIISSEHTIRLGKSLFKRMKKMCDQAGIPLMVLTTGYFHSDGSNEVTRGFLLNAEGIFSALKIPFKDLYPLVAGNPDYHSQDLIIPGEGHPSALGAKLVADAAWPWLRSQLSAHTSKLLLNKNENTVPVF